MSLKNEKWSKNNQKTTKKQPKNIVENVWRYIKNKKSVSEPILRQVPRPLKLSFIFWNIIKYFPFKLNIIVKFCFFFQITSQKSILLSFLIFLTTFNCFSSIFDAEWMKSGSIPSGGIYVGQICAKIGYFWRNSCVSPYSSSTWDIMHFKTYKNP